MDPSCDGHIGADPCGPVRRTALSMDPPRRCAISLPLWNPLAAWFT